MDMDIPNHIGLYEKSETMHNVCLTSLPGVGMQYRGGQRSEELQ